MIRSTIIAPRRSATWVAEASRTHEHYIGFFAQLRVSHRYSHLVARALPPTNSFLAVRELIDAALPAVSTTVRNQRRWLCGNLVVHSIAEFAAAPDEQPYEGWDDLVGGVVTACVRILEGDR